MNPIAIYPDGDLDDYDPPRYCDFDVTYDGILAALDVWDDDKSLALAIIKSVRKKSCESDVLHVASLLINLEHGGASGRDLALYLYSSSRFRFFEDSLAYAEIIVDNTPTKACDIIHKALKKEEEDERIDKILELCEHKLPLFVELAHKELRQMAIRGNIRAMYVLGRSYFSGRFAYEQDSKQAYKWWKKAADKGDPYSMLELAHVLEHGKGVRRNERKAFEIVKSLADNDFAGALTNLAHYYYWGIGTKKDISTAEESFRRAMDMKPSGFAAGAYFYAVKLAKGFEHDNYPLSALWEFEKSAKLGHPGAQCEVGTWYYFGNHRSPDIAKATYWFRLSAEGGAPDGAYNYARRLLAGDGCPRDVEGAIQWLEFSSDKGYAEATTCLGNIYDEGVVGEIDYQKAVHYFRKGHELGDSYSTNNLARCYEEGHGVQKSPQKALELFLEAAKQNNCVAEYNVGRWYWSAKGKKDEIQKALYWLRRSAKHGHPHPLVYLGLAYENGYGVKQNFKKAFLYYKQAHELEPGVGAYQLAACYEKGLGCKQNLAEAKRLYAIAESSVEATNKPKC